MRKRGKTRFVGIRLSEEDYKILRNKVGESGNLSAYCRKQLLHDVDTSEMVQNGIKRDLIYQVRKIGININQAVARMNAGISFYDDGEMLKQELIKVQKLLEQFREE